MKVETQSQRKLVVLFFLLATALFLPLLIFRVMQ
jgi:hypothetical protein